MKAVFTVALMLASAPAFAQDIEFTPLVSYTTPGDLHRSAIGIEDVTITRSFTWGAQVGYFFTKHVGTEGLWTVQSTGLAMLTDTGAPDVMKMRTLEVHGAVVYQFGSETQIVRPFLFGGPGATFFSADGMQSQTKFSWTAGGGVKWVLVENFGVEFRARYKPTELRDSSTTFCAPFGFCQNTLNRWELAGGALFRF